DRFCASSFNDQRRKSSSVGIARLVIILLISLLALLYISTLIAFDLRQSNELGCVPHIDIAFQQAFMIIDDKRSSIQRRYGGGNILTRTLLLTDEALRLIMLPLYDQI
ncbi:unnamed protein product, partial [Rotaria socialis]